MFMREYMEYHKDRFEDSSYLVRKNGEIIAVFPGSQKNSIWSSHNGLTFGGLLLPSKHNRIGVVCDIYKAFFQYLKQKGVDSLLIKPVPWIYHILPCEGEFYSFNFYNIKERHVEVSTTVSLIEQKPIISSLRKRMQKKALKHGLKVEESHSYKTFWDILSSRLGSKYDRMPVHTYDEIEGLARKFPSNIKLFCIQDANQNCIGGSVVFVTNTVWHAQYIAANNEGMELGALDLLFFYLIDCARMDKKRYFDFGISTESNGSYLNKNLALFKEGFGGRSIMHHKILLSL